MGVRQQLQVLGGVGKGLSGLYSEMERQRDRKSVRLGEGRGASTSHTFQQVQELIQLPQRSCLSFSSLRSRPPE